MIKTIKCTPELRWRKPSENELIALVERTHGKDDLVLQQAWVCVETGEVEWRDVLVEK
jgi:hypothetical protein